MESQELRKAGLKVTHPRMRILELLDQARPRHMTAEDIYRALLGHGDEIGLATVYRVLTQFEAAGLVLKHNFEGGHAVYELDRGDHHDHMVDIDTGKVIEFQSAEIEELQRQVAAKHGYEIEEHAHYRVSKAASEGVTRSAVQRLDQKERTEELARMLGGVDVSREARAAAKRLLSDVV